MLLKMLSYPIASTGLTQIKYTITQLEQIEEEIIPLASGPSRDYFGFTVFGLLLLVVVILLLLYVLDCRKYQKKIKRLDDSRFAYCGYGIGRLKETLSELEYDKVNDVDEMF